MIFELFKLMLKEEVRIHTKLFPAFFFYIFPFIAFLISLMLALLVSDVSFLVKLFLLIAFFIGFSSGAYGLQSREIFLRKFPHSNFLLYSYFAMPIKNEVIIFALFLKEITFMFFWFLLPFFIGLFIFNPAVILNAGALFLLGNSITFFLSNVYNKKKIFYPSLLLIGIFLLLSFNILAQIFWLDIILFLGMFALAMKTIDLEYYSKKVFHKDMFDRLMKFLRSPLLTKDFIDLKRSYGFARIIISVIFPIITVYVLLTIFQKVLGPNVGLFVNAGVFYSLMLGMVSLAVYDTMVEFDQWDYYSIFPLRKSDLIKSKLKSSLVITIPMLFILVFVLAKENFIFNVFIAGVSMLYFISLIAYLVGLETRMLLDLRKIAFFSFLFVPYFLLVLFSVQLGVVLPLFFVFSLILLVLGIKKFD
jgi:hypothetical protein